MDKKGRNSKLARKLCVSRQAATSSLAMQQNQRMLARIKYYDFLGWIRARLISKTEDGRVANLVYFEGA